MSLATDPEETKQEPVEDKQERDAKRVETNKTDPQITELKGFFDSTEPLEEEGTINPLTGNPREPE